MTPSVPRPGPRHLLGGLCAGLWKAVRLRAAAFSRTVAMAAAARTPPPQTAAQRSGRQRSGRQLTGPGWGGAPARPSPRPVISRCAPHAAGHVQAGADCNLRPRGRGKGADPAFETARWEVFRGAAPCESAPAARCPHPTPAVGTAHAQAEVCAQQAQTGWMQSASRRGLGLGLGQLFNCLGLLCPHL